MNTFVVFFCVALASANAGILAYTGAVEPGTVVQGPSSHATVAGPDGSVISAVAPGGTVVSSPKVAGVVSHAGVVAAPLAYAAPHVAYAAPHVAYAAPHVTYGAPAVVAHHSLGYAAPAFVGARVVLPAGHGIEGQYLHDYTENLYDDGSYKGEIYA